MSFFVSPNSPPRRSSSHHSSSRHRSSESKPQYQFVRPAASSSRSHHGSSSYSSSRARPRDGYINRMLHQVKRQLRRLYDYARRHPMKLFMLVIMPLITGGALADLLRRFGIRLPGGLERMIPGMSGGGGRGGRYGGSSSFGGGDSVEGVMRLAKMFI